MSDWSFCHKLEAGKRYEITYVYVGSDIVSRATLDYHGEVSGSMAILVLPVEDRTTDAGPINIVSINEVAAEANIKE